MLSVRQNIESATYTEKKFKNSPHYWWQFRLNKKTETNKTEQIWERTELHNIIVKGCVSHPTFEGDGPTLDICKTYSDVQEAYIAFRSLDKNVW